MTLWHYATMIWWYDDMMMERRDPTNRCACRLLSDFTMNKFPRGSSSCNHPSQFPSCIGKNDDQMQKKYWMPVAFQPNRIFSRYWKESESFVIQVKVKGTTFAIVSFLFKSWSGLNGVQSAKCVCRLHTDGGRYHQQAGLSEWGSWEMPPASQLWPAQDRLSSSLR